MKCKHGYAPLIKFSDTANTNEPNYIESCSQTCEKSDKWYNPSRIAQEKANVLMDSFLSCHACNLETHVMALFMDFGPTVTQGVKIALEHTTNDVKHFQPTALTFFNGTSYS